MGGLKESDKNDEGYFPYKGEVRVDVRHNTDSRFIVMHAGNIPGYKILDVLSRV